MVSELLTVFVELVRLRELFGELGESVLGLVERCCEGLLRRLKSGYLSEKGLIVLFEGEERRRREVEIEMLFEGVL